MEKTVSKFRFRIDVFTPETIPTSYPALRRIPDICPSPHAGSQIEPSKVSTDSSARVASGGVG